MLHDAFQKGKAAVAIALLQVGTDPNIKNRDGDRAEDKDEKGIAKRADVRQALAKAGSLGRAYGSEKKKRELARRKAEKKRELARRRAAQRARSYSSSPSYSSRRRSSSSSGGLFQSTGGMRALERIRRQRRAQERENARIRAENRRKRAEYRRRQAEARRRAETRRQREEARRQAEYRRQREEAERRRQRQLARMRQEQEIARQRREHERRDAARRRAWVAKSYPCSEDSPSPGMGAGYIRNLERMRTDTDWRVCRASVNATANDFSRKCASKKRACNGQGGQFTYDVFVRNPKIGSCEHTWEASWRCTPYQPLSFTPNLGTSGAVR